jgi:hypothetical protein
LSVRRVYVEINPYRVFGSESPITSDFQFTPDKIPRIFFQLKLLGQGLISVIKIAEKYEKDFYIQNKTSNMKKT